MFTSFHAQSNGGLPTTWCGTRGCEYKASITHHGNLFSLCRSWTSNYEFLTNTSVETWLVQQKRRKLSLLSLKQIMKKTIKCTEVWYLTCSVVTWRLYIRVHPLQICAGTLNIRSSLPSSTVPYQHSPQAGSCQKQRYLAGRTQLPLWKREERCVHDLTTDSAEMVLVQIINYSLLCNHLMWHAAWWVGPKLELWK